MGCFLSCCKKGDEYEKIPDDVVTKSEKTTFKAESSEFQEVVGESGGFDLSLKVFQGLSVDQKFTSSRSFEKRFIWINHESRTLHMSQYDTKERRHKEASLADVTSVDKRPPQKYKKVHDDEPNETDERFLTVHFVRGGGIDLRFDNTSERDIWFSVFDRFVKQNQVLNAKLQQ